MSTKKTVCLCMIVRDEAHVIERCLRGVRPVIDTWLIVDTGSRDDTMDVVRRVFADLPGFLHERPWRDLAHNRSEALALARPLADYSLIIDADDELIVPPGRPLPELRHDAYMIDIVDRRIVYERLQLVANRLSWRYEGVVHEYLVCEGAGDAGHLPVTMRRNYDGARHRDPLKMRKDVGLLEQALLVEHDPFKRARHTFYLAQSCRDCGESAAAIGHYLARAEMGFWDQEVYVSLLTAGRMMETLGRSKEEVLPLYERASALCPTRLEAVHAFGRLCHHMGDYAAGYARVREHSGRAMPRGSLFGEPAIYAFGLAAVLAANAFEIGLYRESIDACLHVLASPDLPARDRPQMARNLRLALDKLL